MSDASIRGTILAGLLLAATLLATACAGPASAPATGAFEVRSLRDEPVVLEGRCVTAIYDHDAREGTSILLSDLPLETLLAGDFERGQLLHIELLWEPKPGTTPIDRTATNASFRHVVFADGEVGLYGGAGFVLPRDDVGAATLAVDLRQASVTLLESTPGFNDLLSPARMIGDFTATLDPAATRRLYFSISQQVTNALGRSRFVRGTRTADPGA